MTVVAKAIALCCKDTLANGAADALKAPAPFPDSDNSGGFGDFVDSDDECDVESDAEPRKRYWEGLYCPLRIGEVLNSQYRIEHKLGCGPRHRDKHGCGPQGDGL